MRSAYRNPSSAHRRWIWLVFAVATILVLAALRLLPSPYNTANTALAAVGGIWALAFYLHTRHAEDARFNKDLLTEFNGRYDGMNNLLQSAIWSSEAFSKESKLKFIDYFNLCAEEWLFWQTGYVYDQVWNAWAWGMHQYAKDDRVMAIWNEERKSQSYYGFEFPPPKPKS